MAITVLTSIQDNVDYHNNRRYLEKALKEDLVKFDDNKGVNEPETFVFDNKKRVYDFTRSAKAEIRDDMTKYLKRVLPGLSSRGLDKIRGAFDCLFNYHDEYKESLKEVNGKRSESMKMLVFNKRGEDNDYVAHVKFNSTSRRTKAKQYTVDVALSYECFTYFPVQETSAEYVFETLREASL